MLIAGKSPIAIKTYMYILDLRAEVQIEEVVEIMVGKREN